MSTGGFLLDTNVVSETLRPRPDPRVLEWLRLHEAQAWLSVVSIGEIESGIRNAPDQQRATSLRRWLDDVLVPQFAHRLLRVDLAVARRWGELTAGARARGVSVGAVDAVDAVDALIGATAAHHGLAVVTRNVRDFSSFEIEVVDPWASEASTPDR